MSENQTVYHYSPKTGQATICTARSLSTCPYRGYYHNTIKNLVQKYADEENEKMSKLSELEKEELIEKDWAISNEKPLIFMTGSQHAPTKRILSYLGMNDRTINYYEHKYDRMYLFPKTKMGIQTLLEDEMANKIIFTELQEAFDNNEIGNKARGRAYDRWKLMPYIEYSRLHRTAMIMDKEIEALSPSGKKWYSLNDCWNDYIEYKQRKHEADEIEKGKNTFYLIGIRHDNQ